MIFAGIASRVFAVDKDSPPTIDVWYGPHQVFGRAGLAQRWVNILGNVADPDSQVANLSYRLNGGDPVTMRIGPDSRRLLNPGDFNVELDPAQLKAGDNRLVIEAVNSSGAKSTVSVTVTYEKRAGPLPLPYTIDWSKVGSAQEVLQIVDGKWRWDAQGIRPLELGYDRMLAIGDSRWTNYQATVPVTVHGVDPNAFQAKESGDHAGISVDMRWIGHSDDPRACPPPHCGWNPVGAFNKFFFMPDGNNFLGLKLQEKEEGFPTIPYRFVVGHTYVFKAAVRTTPQGNRYQFKVWDQATEKEPAAWMFDRVTTPGMTSTEPDHGAFSLVAHHTDVTWGNVVVEALP